MESARSGCDAGLVVGLGGIAVVVVTRLGGTSMNLGGILIQDRGRYSLARFQLLWWTLVVLHIVASFAAARFTASGLDPLGFTNPGALPPSSGSQDQPPA